MKKIKRWWIVVRLNQRYEQLARTKKTITYIKSCYLIIIKLKKLVNIFLTKYWKISK